jgi:outer membrane protein assembly factor BamB
LHLVKGSGALAAVFNACAVIAWGQFSGGSEWTTGGADAQRTSWMRTDPAISPASMQKAGFQFLWKLKLGDKSKELRTLSQITLLDRYIGYRGFRSLAFLGGSSNDAYAIDSDLGRVEWKRRFTSGPNAAQQQNNLVPCSGGVTVNLTRPTNVAPPGLTRGGRGAPAPVTGGRGAIAAVYAVSSDGMLRTLYVSNGADAQPPVRFLPPNARVSGLILVDNTVYAATGRGCGSTAGGVWAIDLSTPEGAVATWKLNGAGTWGTSGPAIAPDGTVYATTGDGEHSPESYSDSVVALEPKTLRLKDWYTSGKIDFTSSPVIFPYNGRTLMAVTSKDGRIHVLDTASLGGADHQTPLFRTEPYSTGTDFIAGALASWQDANGVRWILAPSGGPVASGPKFPSTNGKVTNGSIVAFKVTDQNSQPVLEPSWVSRDMVSPDPPIIINGVVLALSTGAYLTGDREMETGQRVKRSSPAILYALDGATGKELWNSGNTIASFAYGAGLSGGSGQVYVATHDNTVYAFGFPIEH